MLCTSIAAFNERLTPKCWEFKDITRPFSIIYYSISGSAYYTIDGIERRFENGFIYVLPANKVYSLREDENDKFYAAYLHVFTSPEIKTTLVSKADADSLSGELIALLRKYIARRDHDSVKIITEALLGYMIKSAAKGEVALAERIKSYLDENYLSVYGGQDLSKVFNYSQTYISRVFRNSYKLTPKQYAKRLILNRIALMLNGGASVKQIARELDFSSPENLCRFFKGGYGISPSQYKKEYDAEAR